jgi:hypothetical protein
MSTPRDLSCRTLPTPKHGVRREPGKESLQLSGENARTSGAHFTPRPAVRGLRFLLIAGCLGAAGACGDRAGLPAAERRAASDEARCSGATKDGSLPGVARIWGIHDGEKIERDDLASPYQERNAAWDGERLRIFGARNEVLAFQVIVEAGDAGVEGLRVALPELRQRGGAGVIRYAPPGPDPTEYKGRPIQVFVEHYMHVVEPTRAAWVFAPGGGAAPRDPTGWKPVQLVPEDAAPGRGGLPIDVAPKTNQAIWIEVTTARDLPAGIYDGAVRVSAGGRERVLPIALELFDFTLPDESSLTTMLFFEPDQVERYQGRRLDDRYHRFAHHHRMELTGAYDARSALAAQGRFDGSDFTPAQGYEGPGEGVGNRIVPASFYGPGDDYEDRQRAWATSDAWMTFVSEHLPGAVTFLYMPDEPGPSEYEHIRRIAANVKSNPGPGGALPLFVTSGFHPELDGSIDIWCPLPGSFDIARAAAERAAGRRTWYYNGSRPSSGAVIIDAPATDARVNAWAAFKHGADGYFVWHSNHWQHNAQKVGERDQDVWANPVTFDNRGQPHKPVVDQGFINGDGVLMYPGEEVLHPEEDRGIAGPIATIQLANLRRGSQDHLYLSLARACGLAESVDGALARVVPHVLSDAGGAVDFAEHGDDYEAARHALARAISAAR